MPAKTKFRAGEVVYDKFMHQYLHIGASDAEAFNESAEERKGIRHLTACEKGESHAK